MMQFSKKTFFHFLITFVICGCLYQDVPEPPFISDEQWQLIKVFVLENNYPESVDLDNFVQYLYEEWPYEDKIRDFILTFPIQDTTPRTLVLSDVLTQIGKTLRVSYHDPRTGSVYPAYIDSIDIRTDSVIIIPSLDLSYCNLKNLPAQIKKIRVRNLNIRDNHSTLETLPDEMMQLSEPPFYWDTLLIEYDIRIVEKMDSVSDTLKSWLRSHSAISY